MCVVGMLSKVANLTEDKPQSQEEDDTEYGQAAGNGHAKEHGELLLLTCVECECVECECEV